jgi:RNA polymerase sigma factor (sigma-70 family)
MYGVCLRYAADADEAQDLLQDGFITVFTKLKDYRNDGSLEGWIRKIMVNTCLMYLRKKQLMISDISEGIPLSSDDNIIDQIAAEELIQLLHDLPTGYRMVFNLYAVEGYTHQEIGERLGISEGTSKSQFSRAKKALQQMVQQKMRINEQLLQR